MEEQCWTPEAAEAAPNSFAPGCPRLGRRSGAVSSGHRQHIGAWASARRNSRWSGRSEICFLRN